MNGDAARDLLRGDVQGDPRLGSVRRGDDALGYAVFGWETLGMGPGAAAWRLPGYGDFLEQRDPGLRERMAQSGAPAGFEDVVATMMPIPDDQPDTPAHWSLTFAVDDADATAERAAELGGHVVLPPVDAPWVRMTVIIDPQGATFTASKFVPETKTSAARPARRPAAPNGYADAHRVLR